jgi:hypothetical protein
VSEGPDQQHYQGRINRALRESVQGQASRGAIFYAALSRHSKHIRH